MMTRIGPGGRTNFPPPGDGICIYGPARAAFKWYIATDSSTTSLSPATTPALASRSSSVLDDRQLLAQPSLSFIYISSSKTCVGSALLVDHQDAHPDVDQGPAPRCDL